MAKSQSQKNAGVAEAGGELPVSRQKSSGDDSPNPVGRPPKYSMPEDMQLKVDQFFAECFSAGKPPTISGLAYHLGMATESLRRYGDDDEFSATVKKAKQRVEISLEQRLDASSPTGAIFSLKNNFGWKDAQNIDHTSTDGSMSPSVDLSKLSDAAIAELMNARRRD